MYWRPEPTMESNENTHRGKQHETRHRETFWILVRRKQYREQNDYRFRGGGEEEKKAETRRTQSVAPAEVMADEEVRAARGDRNRQAACPKQLKSGKQTRKQPEYSINKIYAICERAFREEGWAMDEAVEKRQ